MSNREIKESLVALAQAATTQINLSIMLRVKVVESTITSRLRDFVRMNPPIFLRSKVGEDTQEFLDGVNKVLSAMGVTSREKEGFTSYQLRDVSQISYTQLNDNRPEELGPIELEKFKKAFIGKYFPRERRKVKVEEFINLKQGKMSVEEYSLKFSILYRYAPSLVSNPRDDMGHFVTGLADLVK